MEMSIGRLRQIIKEELVAARQAETLKRMLREDTIRVGDIKDALKLLKKHQSKEKAAAAAGKTGLKALIGLLPFGGAITAALDAAEPLKGMYDAAKDVDPKAKKSNKLWDFLTIDPDTSAIVDDAVESQFIEDLKAKVATLRDDDALPDADELLKRYLSGKFRGAHVAKPG